MIEVLLVIVTIIWIVLMIKYIMPSMSAVNELRDKYMEQMQHKWPEDWD